jgi:broad specificity phosphatase PhoE
MAIVAKIYLIRHGETDANRNKIIQGHLDTPLNNTGLKQAISVASALRRVKFDLALSSDLQRTETVSMITKTMEETHRSSSIDIIDSAYDLGASAQPRATQG